MSSVVQHLLEAGPFFDVLAQQTSSACIAIHFSKGISKTSAPPKGEQIYPLSFTPSNHVTIVKMVREEQLTGLILRGIGIWEGLLDEIFI